MAGTKQNGTGTLAANGQNGYKVIGTRPVRPDGVDKVTGRAVYAADVQMTGLLHGFVLRSPHAHAHIRSIDTSKAEALPGVRAVVTAADLPEAEDKVEDLGEGAINLKYLSDNVLASEKVLYHGHAVAAVAATSPHIAEEAAGLIEVDYELLPPVMTVDDALADDAPILLETLRTDSMGEVGAEQTNLASVFSHQRGDLDAGFAGAHLVVDRTYRTETVHQGYIEPHAATALYSADGQIIIWTSTQGSFAVRGQVCEILKIPVSRLKVVPTEIGGGFGGKINVYVEPVAVILSQKAGYEPVKIVMSRADVLAATGPTSGSNIRVKIGVDADGKISAALAELYYEAGAYPGSPVGAAANVSLAPYAIDNLQVDGYDIVVNRPRSAAYRAPGGTNVAFAVESVVDELAEKLDMDPAEFRILNGAKENDRRPDGLQYARIGQIETVEAIRDSEHYQSPLEGKYRGRGIASGYWNNWGGQSSATAVLNPDGTVNLNEASTDIGGTRASIAMQLAEAMDIEYEQVKARVVDTDTVSYNDVTGGSRTTFATGLAAYNLGRQLLKEMKSRLADQWEVAAGDVSYEEGTFSAGSESVSFAEAAGLVQREEPLMASSTVHPQDFGPGFSTQCVDIEVDPDTGKITILRYTIAQDVGKAIHPSYVEGQMQGGVAQGIGWAINEEYIYDDEGRLLNASLLDYRMPTSLDLPMIETIMVEVPHPAHPYGVRGVGEVNIVPPAGAVANAVFQATGVRMDKLPISPANLLEAMWAKEAEAAELVPGDD
ncbi:MAG: xanthine dehydrogenase family protein molybdopterin-binding subunit [Caldilineaceae bacterium SB0668_bin_21]|nr:xanthine dehydrogenase family protein molybdopterin-binding subunit [Caldilineaceae bacterium SB0668_bin_21]MYC21475.1 xanthine dehydrogenase family protein molybdopterin-binding subunit [Caldilineaceae bacterium SB0662_bin_25]